MFDSIVWTRHEYGLGSLSTLSADVDGQLLLESRKDLIAYRAVTVEGVGNWAQHQRSEEIIDVFFTDESLLYDGNELVFPDTKTCWNMCRHRLDMGRRSVWALWEVANLPDYSWSRVRTWLLARLSR